MRKIAVLPAAMLASAIALGGAWAAGVVKKDQSILDRLYANTGVYDKSATAKTPDFVSDPGWPAAPAAQLAAGPGRRALCRSSRSHLGL